ncbi:hypothetical protein, partial [Klebsiella pneumoniae]|uniref:hypothetical protein n=4 Tax=Enterobacterales TaxID=91347 RepID=UPI0031D7D9A1
IILPGATTLTRLISEVREKATLRLWNKLALIPSAEQRSQLEMLLGRHCCKVSDEAAFCLIQRPYISKTLLTRRISPRGSP